VEHLTHLNAACGNIFPRCLHVGDDQVEALGRARRSGCDLRAKLNRAPRAGRCELNDAEAVIKGEVGVEPPAEFGVERLRAVNISDRDDDHLELRVRSLGASPALDVRGGDSSVLNRSNRLSSIRPESRRQIYWTNVSISAKVWIGLMGTEWRVLCSAGNTKVSPIPSSN
jgi:hypothetical protein